MNIAGYIAVSFDIFDTLVKRMTSSPIEIFKYVERELNKQFELKTNYYEKRLQAKERARSKDRYYCIEDVYEDIDLSNDQKNAAIQLERNIEIELCYPNKEVIDFFNYCKQQDKRIFLLSDMYLDKNTIEAMLTKCGIFGYEKLYISQDVKKEKNGGGLFRHFLSENGLAASKVLHLGDNNKVDIISAKLCGIHVKKVNESFNTITYKSNRELNKTQKKEYLSLLRLVEAYKPEGFNEWQSIGYECLGPLLWGFSNWLATRLKEENIKKIFFLSREGDILKKAFETIYNDEFNCFYLHVSRRSLTVPSYSKCKSYEDIVKTITLPRNLTVKQFYEAIGIDYTMAAEGVKKAGLDANTIINGWEVTSNTLLSDSFSYIYDKAFNIYKQQYQLVNKYLDQNHFSEKVAIVDIGWNGTMQSALEKLCDEGRKAEIHGYYFGLNENNKLENSIAEGYIYAPHKYIEFQYYLMGMSGPLEMMTTARHGTTLCYMEENGKVIPQLGKSEYFGIEEKPEAAPILKMQDGGMTFVKKLSEDSILSNQHIEGRVAVQNFYQFGKNPTAKHRKLFYGLKEYDGTVGLVMLDPNIRGFKGEHSILKGFWNSSWKIGYMKDKIGLPLPYEKIYKFMRKRK